VSTGLAADVVATITGNSIIATVPFGTDVSALIPTFATTGASVTVAGTAQVSSVTANNFTSPVTYVVTAADSSFQQYTVTVTVDASSNPAGTYYVNSLLTQTGIMIGIATSGSDVYVLEQVTTTSFALQKVDAAGTITTLATTSASTTLWKDIVVAGNYLFLLQSITTGTTTYSVVRYLLSDPSTPTTLNLPTNTAAKRFATDSEGGIVYMVGTMLAKGIIFFDGDSFTTTTIAKTANVYTALAYRSGYLYGINGSNIYEIPVATLSTTTASPQTSFACPIEVIVPNLIMWVPDTASFFITDRSTSGSMGGGTSNGQIYSYQPTFSSGGGLLSLGSGTLWIRGNSGSGSTETPFATVLPINTPSTDSAAYLYQTAAISYNINDVGYVNLFAGNGTSSGTGYLVKFYDSVFGSSTGGQ
jgi:hypothetical protein